MWEARRRTRTRRKMEKKSSYNYWEKWNKTRLNIAPENQFSKWTNCCSSSCCCCSCCCCRCTENQVESCREGGVKSMRRLRFSKLMKCAGNQWFGSVRFRLHAHDVEEEQEEEDDDDDTTTATTTTTTRTTCCCNMRGAARQSKASCLLATPHVAESICNKLTKIIDNYWALRLSDELQRAACSVQLQRGATTTCNSQHTCHSCIFIGAFAHFN